MKTPRLDSSARCSFGELGRLLARSSRASGGSAFSARTQARSLVRAGCVAGGAQSTPTPPRPRGSDAGPRHVAEATSVADEEPSRGVVEPSQSSEERLRIHASEPRPCCIVQGSRASAQNKVRVQRRHGRATQRAPASPRGLPPRPPRRRSASLDRVAQQRQANGQAHGSCRTSGEAVDRRSRRLLDTPRWYASSRAASG